MKIQYALRALFLNSFFLCSSLTQAQSPVTEVFFSPVMIPDFFISNNDMSYTIHGTSMDICRITPDVKQSIQNVNLLVSRVGRAGNFMEIRPGSANFTEKTYTCFSDKFTTEYIHERDGIRQNFYVPEAPSGDGELIVTVEINTDLSAVQMQDQILFCRVDVKGSFPVIAYHDLVCWDANKIELKSHFSLSKDKRHIEIFVDDENALYPVTIDPISTTPLYTLVEEQVSSDLSIAEIAGDVNNDGYDDLIVGAPEYNTIYSDAGKAYLYLGSALGFSITPVWSATGTSPYTHFGEDFEKAGDVNGDGYDDVFIQYSGGLSRLYLGSATGSLVTSITYTGFVTAIGDINSDSYADFLIVDKYYDGPETNEGKATLYKGSAGTITSSWSFETNQANAYLTFAANAGDLNNDGYNDLAFGAPSFDNGQTDEGKAYVFYGSAAGFAASPDWTYENNITSYDLGNLYKPTDLNSDGYDDLVIGGNGPDSLSSKGHINVFYGSPTGLAAVPGWKYIMGGKFLTTGGDLNGDGYDDILILNGYTASYDPGSIVCLPGSVNGLNDERQFRFFEGLIYSVNITGHDYSGDGFDELLIGMEDPSTLQDKIIMISGGNEDLRPAFDKNYIGSQGGAGLGLRVASAGDVNNDGFDDALVSSPFYDNAFLNAGKVDVYLGTAAGLSPLPVWSYEGDKTDMNAGLSLGSAGDFNNDGFDDIIIGFPKYDDSLYTDQGMVKVFFGGSSGINSLLTPWTKKGFQANCQFGYSVSKAGDFNVDGIDDIIVGAPYYDNGSTDEGKAFVFYGSAVPSLTAGWSAEANASTANFGTSVSGGGDVNGDGRSDILIGAPNYLKSSTKRGQIYLYLGSPGFISPFAKWQAYGTTADKTNNIGSSVDITGDYNNDGLNDILAATSESMVIYNGRSPKPKSVFSSFFYTTSVRKVKNGGDLNGDGSDDIISGSQSNYNGSYAEGMFYINYGTYFGLTPQFRYYESDKAQAKLTSDIAGNADFNNDGYGDIIAGASTYRNGELYTGSFYYLEGDASDCNDLSSVSHDQTFTTVTFSSLPFASRYDIRYRVSGSAEWIYDSSYSSAFTISGLDSCTTYEYQMQSICETGTGAWSPLSSFGTDCLLPPCALPPDDLHSINLSPTSTRVIWNISEDAILYTLQYRKTGTTAWTTSTVFAIYKDLTGLIPATSYQFRVKATCETAVSAYSAIQTFTTDPLKLADTVSINNTSIFPNPSDGIFYIETSAIDQYHVKVFNMEGKFLYGDEFDGNDHSLDLSGLPLGLYIVYIESSASATIHQITIIK